MLFALWVRRIPGGSPGRFRGNPHPEPAPVVLDVDESLVNRMRMKAPFSAWLLIPTVAFAMAQLLPAADADPCAGVKIDTHIHLYDPGRPEGVPWPPKDNPVLYRTHLLPQFLEVARPVDVTHAIIVEASEWEEDNDWVLDLAEKSPELLGVIGNLDPRGEEFGAKLERLCQRREFLGLRLRRGKDVGLATPNVEANLALLARHGRVLELLVPMVPAEQAAAFARRHPDLRVIIDHVAGAKLRDGKVEPEWEKGVRELAACPAVFCKISGFYPAAAPNGQPAPLDLETYRPIFEVLWQAFGRERLFFGSNWPVSNMGGPYPPTVRLVEAFWREKGGEDAVRDVLCRNALRVYGIDAAALTGVAKREGGQ